MPVLILFLWGLLAVSAMGVVGEWEQWVTTNGDYHYEENSGHRLDRVNCVRSRTRACVGKLEWFHSRIE